LVALANPVIVDEKSGSVKSEVCSWHKSDLRFAAYEGPFTSALPTLGAECLVSGGKPTVFERALKVGS
jgi:hypothetical protein